MLKFHKDAIISNLTLLVDETNLNTLVPELIKRNVFNGRMITRILNPAHTSKRQKLDLYTEILKRGPQAFSNLVYAMESSNHAKLAQVLKESELGHQTEVSECSSTSANANRYLESNNDEDSVSIKSLKSRRQECPDSEASCNLSSNSKAQTVRFCGQCSANNSRIQDINSGEPPVDSHYKLFKYPAYMKNWEEAFESSEFRFSNNIIICSNERFLPVKVKPALKIKEQTGAGPPVYKMDSDPRGLALIVNNINFDDSEEYRTRYGADNDEYRLKLLLEQLHYVVEVHQNKTKNEMLAITEKFSQREELNECDSIIVTFMSHGEEGDTEDNSKIVGIDGFCVSINDIVSYFYNDACKALINKPKVFFFQACRGVLEDTGVTLEHYFPRERIEKDGKHIRFPSRYNKIRSQSDIFMACPVPPGKKANRDRITGTWFIQTIVEVFSEHAWNTHLEDMMKMVDLNIKNTNNLYTSNFQALTTKTIGWNRNLFFNPGLARNKSTGEMMRIGNFQSNSIETDEGMDVVDCLADALEKSNPNSPVNNYSKLKEDKDDEENTKGNGCYNFLGCNAI